MKVLLIQLKRIGDLILTLPAIAAVRQVYAGAEITLVVAHGSRGLLPAIPGVDHKLVARGRASDVALWLTIARKKFDYCLDFSRTDRSAFLSFLSGARERITFDTVRREPVRQLSYNQFIPSQVQTAHTVDYHLTLLAPLGVHDPSPEVHLALPESARKKASEITAQQKLGENFVLLHPGSARAEKFWRAQRWAELANTFPAQNGIRLALTGGASAMEQMHIAQIKSFLTQPIVDLSAQLDLLVFAALIERARLLVTIDSAPMHLAGALGVPQVVLFGPTNPFHWRPRGTPAIILQGKAAGRLQEFGPRQAPSSMNEISTTQVINAMQSLLSAPAAPDS